MSIIKWVCKELFFSCLSFMGNSASLYYTLKRTIKPNRLCRNLPPPHAQVGTYTFLSSSGITGSFDSVTFVGATPSYTLSYLPEGSPTFVKFELLGGPNSTLSPPSDLRGEQKKNDFGLEYELYNQRGWDASPSTQKSGYCIYRNGETIAQVDSSIDSYTDHNREKGISYSYAVTAFNAEGQESAPITLLIIP